MSLIAILLVTFFFLHKELSAFSGYDRFEAEQRQRRESVNRFFVDLYRTEVLAQVLNQGRTSDFNAYRIALSDALASADSLCLLMADSLQISRIDSIRVLLKIRDRSLENLVWAASAEKKSGIRNIQKLRLKQDSLLDVQEKHDKIIAEQDSIIKKSRNKGFFKRFVEVFSPDKKTARRIDSLQNVRHKTGEYMDSIAVNLKESGSRYEEDMGGMQARTWLNLRKVLQENQSLTVRISGLIHEFEQKERAEYDERVMQYGDVRMNALHMITMIAIIAILLALVFGAMIWRDITRGNRYRKELEIARKKAEELLSARENLMLTITHDFKAPLSSIIGYTELLSRLTKGDRQKYYLSNMKHSSEHLLRLVTNLLDFHRLDSHKIEANNIPFNPKLLFDEIVTAFEPVVAQKGLKLIYKSDPRLQGHFEGDPLRLKQIADNLLSNAIKFTRRGSITLHLFEENGSLCFSVSDTGKGIAKSDLEKIFQEFTRLPGAQGEEGFGLGLTITRQLVNLLSGEIIVGSEEGVGSNFTVRLPLIPVETTSLKKSGKTLMLENVRILCIDDDKLQLEMVKAMLEQEGGNVTICNKVDDLLLSLERGVFDLIMTDLQMPEINGFDLLSKLRKSGLPTGDTIPVIAVTARSDANERHLQERGFAGCLHKPFSTKELIGAVLSALDKSMIDRGIEEDFEQRSDWQGEYDFDALTAFAGDDRTACTEILATFLAETSGNIEKMEQAFEAHDMRAIAGMAHKLLPLFTMIKALRAIPALSWLEQRRDKEYIEEVSGKVSIVITEARRIVEELQKNKEIKE